MKFSTLTVYLFILAFSSNLTAQYCDTDLKDLAKEVAKQIDSKGIERVAVWGFFTEQKEHKSFQHFVRDDFAIYLANSAEKFAVIDRQHLELLLKEHYLNFEGYIDAKTTKKLGKVSAVDGVVIGTYIILNNKIRIRVKVLDTETALQFAGTIGNLPIDDDIAKMLGKL
jgi:TolB-like protein